MGLLEKLLRKKDQNIFSENPKINQKEDDCSTAKEHESYTIFFDSRSGQYMGDYEVSVDDSDVVFKLFNLDNFERKEPGLTDDYLLLAELVEPEPDIKRGSSFKCYELRQGNPLPFSSDINYIQASDEKLLETAKKLGPLFGEAGLNSELLVIKESKSAWFSAAKIMNFCVRGESILFHPEKHVGELDNDLFYVDDIFENDSHIQKIIKIFDADIPDPYRSMLQLSDEQYKRVSYPRPFTEDVPYITEWVLGDPIKKIPTSLSILLFIGMRGSKKTASLVYSGSFVRQLSDIDKSISESFDSEKELSVEQSYIETLNQSLIALHTSKVSLGWASVLQNSKSSNASLDLFFNNYLEYLWYCLGRQASKRNIRVCEGCGKIFPARNDRRDEQRFCTRECQNRTKSRRQRQRETAIESLAKEFSKKTSIDKSLLEKRIYEELLPLYSSEEEFKKRNKAIKSKVLKEIKEKQHNS